MYALLLRSVYNQLNCELYYLSIVIGCFYFYEYGRRERNDGNWRRETAFF